MATKETVDPPRKEKDRWEKIEIILSPVGGLFTAVTIALLGYFTTQYLNKNQERDTRTRLYTELMSRREDAESSIRKDMFNSIMSNILGDSATIDERILQLELLTYNFHESLNLMPLFEYLERKINNKFRDGKMSMDKKQEMESRLLKLSRSIISKQMWNLEGVGKTAVFSYTDTVVRDKDSLIQAFTDYDTISKGEYCSFNDTMYKGNSVIPIKQNVYLWVSNYDTDKATVKVGLNIQTFFPDGSISFKRPEFTVSYFEFPMIDNTRLENDKRLAVVLRSFDCDESIRMNEDSTGCLINHRIEFKVIYFPGSYSSMKEKPYFDDIVSKLLPEK